MRENMSPPGNRYLTAVMGDGMTKKHHLLLYSLLGVCQVIAVGFAIAAQRGVNIFQRMNQVNDLPAGQGAPGVRA